MGDVSIGNKTSPEANWNRQADRQTGGQTGKPMCREAAPPKIFCVCLVGSWNSNQPAGAHGINAKISRITMHRFLINQYCVLSRFGIWGTGIRIFS